MVSDCTAPGGVGSITASSKKNCKKECSRFANNAVFDSWKNIVQFRRQQVFPCSNCSDCLSHAQARTVTWLHVPQEKMSVPIVAKVSSGRQSLMAPRQTLLGKDTHSGHWAKRACSGFAGIISKTKRKSGGHGFKHGLPRVSYLPSGRRAWRFICVLESVWLTDDIEYPTRLRVRNSFRCRAKALSPSLWSAPTLQLVVCVVSSGPKYPSRASGGSCLKRDQASSDSGTTWNGTCMQYGGCRYWHPCRGAKKSRHSKSQALLASGWSRLDGNFSWRQSTWTTLIVLAFHNKMPNGDSMFALWRRLVMSLTLCTGLLTSSSAIWAL